MRFTKGDHIKAMRIGYAHHGIYVGDGRVLHYLDNKGVCECSLEKFAEGMPTDAVTYLVLATFSPDEIVRRAYSRLGESEYSLVFKNCEHVATWCACGLEHSGQVQRGAAVLAGVGAFAVRNIAVRAAGGVVLGGTAAKAAGAGAAAKLGVAGLGTAAAVSAPVVLALGAVFLVSVAFASLLDD